jgi:hypothetical protein
MPVQMIELEEVQMTNDSDDALELTAKVQGLFSNTSKQGTSCTCLFCHN